MSSHYATVARAIETLAAQGDTPLDALARDAGLSPAHFQKLFTAWAGVSPKRFAQHLSLERAKRALAESSVLDATQAAGLSSPGRLHDLFVAAEAVTPGEFRRRGDGLTLRYGWADSPFGEALAIASPRGLCALAFVGDAGRDACFDEATAPWSRATLVRDDDAVARSARAVFDDDAPLRLHLRGTPFQLKVWEALLRVPPGRVVSYESLAGAVGAGRAARAVGSAVASNAIAYAIPCHRVIRATGAISGYRWGVARKAAMLGWEAARSDTLAG